MTAVTTMRCYKVEYLEEGNVWETFAVAHAPGKDALRKYMKEKGFREHGMRIRATDYDEFRNFRNYLRRWFVEG
jgi:hypothetical protein